MNYQGREKNPSGVRLEGGRTIRFQGSHVKKIKREILECAGSDPTLLVASKFSGGLGFQRGKEIWPLQKSLQAVFRECFFFCKSFGGEGDRKIW